ncbi:restriction endonuclease [Actinopolymorpha pittospori]
MSAWIIRAGRNGEREQWALDKGVSGGGFRAVFDLTPCTSKERVRATVDAGFPTDSLGRRANFAGQLWALRDTIKPGDLILMPMKTSKKIVFGVCTSGYKYRGDEPDLSRRHTIGVEWSTTEVSRAGIKDDLLNTINGAMTIFQASKNNAEARLRIVMKTGVDPGNGSGATPTLGQLTSGTATGGDDNVVDPTSVPTLEVIRDRVRTHLVEHFGQHKLTHLIADILRVQGYTCDVAPPGPDFGVDIIAGCGPLGLDPPTLIVEVKSEAGSIGAPIVRGLRGAMVAHKADQGLLVAWGGLSKAATDEIRTARLSIRVWDAEDVLDHLFGVYDHLPDETRARVPLKRIWVLDEETG